MTTGDGAAHLTHVALRTPDVDATIRFYQDYAGLVISHERIDRGLGEDTRVVWLAETPDEPDFVLVILPGDAEESRIPPMEHLGFAVDSQEEVRALAEKAKADGILIQGPVQLPPPVGYFCIMRDPSGNRVEFSYGQPINPAE